MRVFRILFGLGLSSLGACLAHAEGADTPGKGFVAQTRCEQSGTVTLSDGEFQCSDHWKMVVPAATPGQSISLVSGMSRPEVASALDAGGLTYLSAQPGGDLQFSAFELRFRDGHLWAVAVLRKSAT